MSFTPGPWRLVKVDNRVYVCAEKNKRVSKICAFTFNNTESGTFQERPVCEANAQLVAAAPDLYHALRLSAAVLAGEELSKLALERALEAARDALQKAGGDHFSAVSF